jgi:hypothetical protein
MSANYLDVDRLWVAAPCEDALRSVVEFAQGELAIADVRPPSISSQACARSWLATAERYRSMPSCSASMAQRGLSPPQLTTKSTSLRRAGASDPRENHQR